jgi:hypothetical protein
MAHHLTNADLHSHSTVSDGTLAPEAVAALAAERGVELWALTDHDEVAGQARARAAALAAGLNHLTGCEISVSFAGETVHIVGLGFDPHDSALVAERLLAIRAEHGPESIAFYISGQLLTEEYHAFNKLARGLIGTNHIDSNSRLCMSSAVVGYKQSLGADAPPACYDDLNHADCVFISGAIPAWAHPILFRRLEDARAAKPANPR